MMGGSCDAMSWRRTWKSRLRGQCLSSLSCRQNTAFHLQLHHDQRPPAERGRHAAPCGRSEDIHRGHRAPVQYDDPERAQGPILQRHAAPSSDCRIVPCGRSGNSPRSPRPRAIQRSRNGHEALSYSDMPGSSQLTQCIVRVNSKGIPTTVRPYTLHTGEKHRFPTSIPQEVHDPAALARARAVLDTSRTPNKCRSWS